MPATSPNKAANRLSYFQGVFNDRVKQLKKQNTRHGQRYRRPIREYNALVAAKHAYREVSARHPNSIHARRVRLMNNIKAMNNAIILGQAVNAAVHENLHRQERNLKAQINAKARNNLRSSVASGAFYHWLGKSLAAPHRHIYRRAMGKYMKPVAWSRFELLMKKWESCAPKRSNIMRRINPNGHELHRNKPVPGEIYDFLIQEVERCTHKRHLSPRRTNVAN